MVVAAKSLRVWNTSVVQRYKTFPVVLGELTLCRTNPRLAIKAVGLAVLVRSAGPITPTVGAGEEEVRFPLAGWFGESHPMFLV